MDQDRTWGSVRLIGLSYFTVLLQQDKCYPMLAGFDAIVLRCTSADQGKRQLARVVMLPAAHFWQEGITGSTAWV